MSQERIDDLPEAVPERAKTHRDATIVMPLASPGEGAPASEPDFHRPLDSYQPPGPHRGTTSGPASSSARGAPSQRELIVPSTATVSSILAHVQRDSADRLEIESRLASGGMGSIDLAIDRALDRRVALKTLHPHLRSNEQSVRMFLREARLTGLLDHPHIVPVYDLGEREGGQLFFAMKLVEGRTLADMIRALPRGALDTSTLYSLLDVIAKVCDALAFAHSRGVLHCDVKPANVMVGEFGQVFLMDWGIARLVAADGAPPSSNRSAAFTPPRRSSHTDNAIIGTPCYMSPEQARGDRSKLDVRSDVFLLGAMLYELLTHRPPYASGDRGETLTLAAAGVFPSPRKLAGEAAVPLELDRIVMRAMARSPDDRYPSIAALKEDLLRFMRGGAEFPRRRFEPGEVIVREGESGDAAYIIVEGSCEIRKTTPAGTQTLQTVGPGHVFGEMAILTQGPRTATVIATESTTVLVVTSQVLEQEMAALKPWMATLLKSLATRFRDIDTQHRASYARSSGGLRGAYSPPGDQGSPKRIANHLLMHLETWGDVDANGGRFASLTALVAELEADLAVPPLALFGAIARYGFILDADEDRLTIPDPKALRARLAHELGRATG